MIRERPHVVPARYYTQKEAAAALQVTRQKIAKMEACGDLRFYSCRWTKRRVTTGADILRCWDIVRGNRHNE